MNELTYRSRIGQQFQATVKAARLVPDRGTAGLPSPFGTFQLEFLADPARFGLSETHPLQRTYPGLVVQHYALVVPRSFYVERAGVQGVSLYWDYNRSGWCAEVASEMGRNALAPFPWEDKPGSETDPAAQPFLEWRPVRGKTGILYWQSYMVHGPKFRPLDWRDGTPDNLEYMYDPEKGQVRQSILVPKEARGIGLAEQTLAAEEVADFYSILLWFPRPENLHLLGRQRDEYDEVRSFSYAKGGETLGPRIRGATRRDFLESAEEVARPIQAELKLAAGGLIKQHIARDIYGPGFWADQPEVLIVLVPVTEEQAETLFTSRVQGRKTF